jgi:predicted dehydrogenase
LNVGELNVAVLGAGGTIAPAVIRDLAESDEVAALRLLDVDEERAAAAAREHGGGRAQACAADARNGLADRLGDCDDLFEELERRGTRFEVTVESGVAA